MSTKNRIDCSVCGKPNFRKCGCPWKLSLQEWRKEHRSRYDILLQGLPGPDPHPLS